MDETTVRGVKVKGKNEKRQEREGKALSFLPIAHTPFLYYY
jgi:hypothetical protein